MTAITETCMRGHEQEPAPSAPCSTADRTSMVTTLIIGSGFSGLAVAALLDRAGIRDWLILERGAEIGGTWRDNTYPGCACDIPAPLYSYSFAQNPHWTELFARQPEILDYLLAFVEGRGLRSRISTGCDVASARWDERTGMWDVRTTQGESYRSRFLISAVGLLHRPKIPPIHGIEGFRGELFHSARWNHVYDLRGKKVVVVGTGASAVQFVPAIAAQVSSMVVFQRTPAWILPKHNRVFNQCHQLLAKLLPPYRWYHRAKLYWVHEQRASGFIDVTAINGKTVSYALRNLERGIDDPELRAALTPNYALGCKRLVISSDFYPALRRPNVELVAEGVAEFYPGGVIDSSGRRIEADCVILGTGFDAQDALTEMKLVGRGGRTLADVWARGMTAYLGTVVPSFPNFFIMMGPNTGLGHNSQIVMIEAQARYIVRAIRKARRSRRSIEVRSDVANSFASWLDGRMASTVWNAGGCTSWYLDSRSGKNTLLWPSTTIDFLKRTARVRASDYVFR